MDLSFSSIKISLCINKLSLPNTFLSNPLKGQQEMFIITPSTPSHAVEIFLLKGLLTQSCEEKINKGTVPTIVPKNVSRAYRDKR